MPIMTLVFTEDEYADIQVAAEAAERTEEEFARVAVLRALRVSKSVGDTA